MVAEPRGPPLSQPPPLHREHGASRVVQAVALGASAIIVALIAFGGFRTLSWMETASFCSQCHTMQPQVVAYESSPHAKVACAECHVGGGLRGMVSSKLDGLNQMVKFTTGRYARPVAHGLPPPQETCLHCHDPGGQQGDVLITRTRFQSDEANTPRYFALVMRLADRPDRETAGIHWHVKFPLEYLPRDEQARAIDWVGVEYPDGTRAEFIAGDLVDISGQARTRAEELLLSGEPRRMTCYDCHNRVGHDFPKPGTAIDNAMLAGRIDPDIPYIKSWGTAMLRVANLRNKEPEWAISRLAARYHSRYPHLFLEKPDSLRASLGNLALIYEQSAGPPLEALYDVYPSYLGHRDSTGCFRCHDGGHFRIEDGRLSEQAIPSTCTTCHTFPSDSFVSPTLTLGPPIQAHELSGMIDGEIDDILFEHASVIRDETGQSCKYCHLR